jgi:hypothetical protein
MNSPLEWVRENKAETMWLGLGAAALAYEFAAPDKDRDLLSHAADRHQVVTAVMGGVVLSHLCNVWQRVGRPELDVISHIGKHLFGKPGDAEV